jgi:hypothetical protein
MNELSLRVAAAVQHYWMTLGVQAKRQGGSTGVQDVGGRRAATGGAQLDGFIHLVSELLIEAGVPDVTIFRRQNTELPGYFRPTKEWDLLVVVEGQLLASIEFKSQTGPSFGNNFNNRAEEAVGSATDLWTAFREGAFKGPVRPWLGYFILLEDAPGSKKPVGVREPHFSVFPEFHGTSYADRYRLLCERLVRERLYDAACFLLSDRAGGVRGMFREPSEELSFRAFVASLIGHATNYLIQTRKRSL